MMRGSGQLRWLHGRLRAPAAAGSPSGTGRASAPGGTGDQRDVAPLWDALREHAAIVVTGHDHDMQRFKPIDGIAQYVSGAGGHGRYALRGDRRLAFGNDRDYGALRIELRPAARLAFVRRWRPTSRADASLVTAPQLTCRTEAVPSARR